MLEDEGLVSSPMSAPVIGIRQRPSEGMRAPAARGTATKLYPNAQLRFCLILARVRRLTGSDDNTARIVSG